MTSILHDPGRTMTRFVHVANGTSTTLSIEAAGIPGRTSIWADPLHEGPVPGNLTDDELVSVRAGWLAAATGERAATVASELRAWRAAIAGVEPGGELILWFEHDLFDQLNLIQLLDFIGEAGERPGDTSLICIDRHEGHPRFKGLGELSPTEIAGLLDTRSPVTTGQIAQARQAWRAFRSADPRDVAAVAASGDASLPFLAAALRRLLEEFPWTTDGLSRSERRLLRLVGEGHADIQALLPRMHDGETAFYIADESLLGLARGLSRSGGALLDGSSGPVDPVPRWELARLGAQVLQGGADLIERCGVDRWVGGVRLEGRGPTWRWSPESESLIWR